MCKIENECNQTNKVQWSAYIFHPMAGVVDALSKYVTSNCGDVLHENCRMSIQTGLRCRIRAVHVAIVYISEHKCDYICGMDICLSSQAPNSHLKWMSAKENKKKNWLIKKLLSDPKQIPIFKKEGRNHQLFTKSTGLITNTVAPFHVCFFFLLVKYLFFNSSFLDAYIVRFSKSKKNFLKKYYDYRLNSVLHLRDLIRNITFKIWSFWLFLFFSFNFSDKLEIIPNIFSSMSKFKKLWKKYIFYHFVVMELQSSLGFVAI